MPLVPVDIKVREPVSHQARGLSERKRELGLLFVHWRIGHATK